MGVAGGWVVLGLEHLGKRWVEAKKGGGKAESEMGDDGEAEGGTGGGR